MAWRGAGWDGKVENVVVIVMAVWCGGGGVVGAENGGIHSGGMVCVAEQMVAVMVVRCG